MNIEINFDSINMRAGMRLFGKVALVMAAVIFLMFGLPFLILFSFGEMVNGASRVPGITTGIIFTLLGAGFLLWFILIRKNEKLIDSYIAFVANKSVVGFKTLAEYRGTTEDVVVKELYSIIKKGYFRDAYMDLENRRIMFPNDDLGGAMPVSCSRCGAAFTAMSGYAAICPYCNEAVNKERKTR